MYFKTFSGLVYLVVILDIFLLTSVHSSLVPENYSSNFLKSELSEEADDEYGDILDQIENVNKSRQRHENVFKGIGVVYSWGRWEKWSKCVNSCVQVKRRKCIERISNGTQAIATETAFYPTKDKKGCFGILKRYRICKEDHCKLRHQSLRDEQCEKLNRIPYNNKFYNWVGYEKEYNECELFCRPSDSDIFVSMNKSVIDGTPCKRPAVYYTHYYRRKAVCVEGICLAVHSSGAMRPISSYDSPLRCGSILCQEVSEVFSKMGLSSGYHHIVRLPTGAMNVSIEQIMPSDNVLTLKSTEENIFIINGPRASESGIFEYNGNVFDYMREKGLIMSTGPLNKPIELLLFVVSTSSCIKYKYIIPVSSASISEKETQTHWDEYEQPISETYFKIISDTNFTLIAPIRKTKRLKYTWKLLGFGQCNRTCGPGYQTPIFRCVRDSPTRFYSPKRCASVEKPIFNEFIYHCNRGLCPPYWQFGNFSECKCKEGFFNGLRTRLVKCVQENIRGNIEDVSLKLCSESKKFDIKETCKCSKPMRRSIHSRSLKRTPEASSRLMIATSQMGKAYNTDSNLFRNMFDIVINKSGAWLMSQWLGNCTLPFCDSATQTQYRSIYCDRTPPKTELCDQRFIPKQKRLCSKVSENKCKRSIWFTSEWNDCKGDCFNLKSTRIVLCLRDGQVVDEAECENTQKPNSMRKCSSKDVDYCGPQWHYSEWSECSRICGEGVQRRYAKCLDYDWEQNALRESNNCNYLNREPVYRFCNWEQCTIMLQLKKN